jgi:hypothetical protein
MAWNNPYYPQGGAMPDQLTAYKQPYQPTYTPPQNPMMQAAQSMMQPQSPMQWVQGEMAAKAWSVPPGGSAVLWDSEAPLIYIKSADQMGMPQMRVLRWEEYRPEPPKTESAAGGEYAPISAVRELENRIASLAQRIEEITHGEDLNNGK